MSDYDYVTLSMSMVYVGISLSIHLSIMSSERIWQSSLYEYTSFFGLCTLRPNWTCLPTRWMRRTKFWDRRLVFARHPDSRIYPMDPPITSRGAVALGFSLGGPKKHHPPIIHGETNGNAKQNGLGHPKFWETPIWQVSTCHVQAEVMRKFKRDCFENSLRAMVLGNLTVPEPVVVSYLAEPGDIVFGVAAPAHQGLQTHLWISFQTDLWQVLQVLPSFSFFLFFFPPFFSFTQHHSTIKQPGGVAKACANAIPSQAKCRSRCLHACAHTHTDRQVDR